MCSNPALREHRERQWRDDDAPPCGGSPLAEAALIGLSALFLVVVILAAAAAALGVLG